MMKILITLVIGWLFIIAGVWSDVNVSVGSGTWLYITGIIFFFACIVLTYRSKRS